MALDPKLLDSLPDTLVDMYGLVEIDILQDMARRISTYDYFIPAALHQNQKLQELGLTQEYIIQALSGMTGQTQEEIVDLLTIATEEAIEDDVDYYTRADVYEPSKVNTEALHAQLNSGLLKTQQAFFNITGTTANTATKQFERALDRAWTQINTGGFDYTTAIRRAITDLANEGISVIEYPSGHRDTLEVAVRRAVVTGANQTAAKTQEVLADELGVDLVEVTAHGGARPEHAKWQGQVYSRKGEITIDGVTYKDFETETGYGTGAGLGGWNCRHNFHPYVHGTSRTYTDEMLEDYNKKDIKYNDKEYTEYEASQIQRRIEREIRKAKRTVEALEAVGEDASEERSKLRKMQKSYTDFSEQTGLKKQSARTQIGTAKAQREVAKANKKDKEYMSASVKSVDLSTAKETKHSVEELSSIEKHAKDNGIKVFQIQNFDGDSEVLKEQIDTVNQLKTKFGLSQKITIKFAKLAKSDLAATSKNGKTITFNLYALRDRILTNNYLMADDELSSTDIRGIAAHEMGHVLQTAYGNKGLDIARKAYYNIYGRSASNSEIIRFLKDNVSRYSIVRSEEHRDQPPKSKYFREIIPEIMGKNETAPDEFTREFIELLKKEWEV